MTDILPPAGWPNVRQLETNEFASGGANGNMNEQAKSLAARSELLKQYAALPYESKTGGYALNERVQLATGDIVKSTVPNNSTNPNINMTGWFVPYMRGSQNLVELTDKATSRSNLDVYSKGEALAKNNNLSELSDKATARTNLDVYSKVETNANIASAAATPNATETTAGKAKIATTAIAQAGTNDADFLTAKKLRDALNANGSAPVYACRAWLNMNGQGGVTIRASANIASVVREQVGVYLVKTSVAMPVVNFAVLVGGSYTSSVSGTGTNGNINVINVSENSFRVFYSDGGLVDIYNLTLGVFC